MNQFIRPYPYEEHEARLLLGDEKALIYKEFIKEILYRNRNVVGINYLKSPQYNNEVIKYIEDENNILKEHLAKVIDACDIDHGDFALIDIQNIKKAHEFLSNSNKANKEIFNKIYDGIDILDLQDNVFSAINNSNIPQDENHLLKGEFKVSIEYIPET